MIAILKIESVFSFLLAATILFYVLPKMRERHAWHIQGLNILAASFTYLGWELWAYASGQQVSPLIYTMGNSLSVIGGFVIILGFWLAVRGDKKASKQRDADQ